MNPQAYWASAEGERGTASPRAFFKDREIVRACAVLPGRTTGADFVIAARHPRGTWSRWRTIATLSRVASDAYGVCSVEWKLADDERFNRWAFADFRFEVTMRGGGKPARMRSGILRHYAGIVGFYGFGPVGERWSNADIRRVARAVGGVAIGPRDPVALRRLAACVPPDEQKMRLYGYSLGGRAAVRWAGWLARRGIGVALLVGIDPVDLAAKTLVVPPNVRRAVSYYQRNGARTLLLPGPAGRGLAFAAADAATVVENHRVADWQVGNQRLPVMHEDMPRALQAEATALLSPAS